MLSKRSVTFLPPIIFGKSFGLCNERYGITMLKCEHCGVTVSENHSVCPLCQGDLTGECDFRCVYPKTANKMSRLAKAMRFVLFLLVFAVIICLSLDLVNGGKIWIYAAAVSASVWIILSIIAKMRFMIAKCILWTTAAAVIEAILWDIATKYSGWSVDYVMPLCCCAAMLAMVIAAQVKHLQIEDYLAYMLIDILFGAVSFILLLTGIVGSVIPSVICIALSAVFLSALLIFHGHSLASEISRRMHM